MRPVMGEIFQEAMREKRLHNFPNHRLLFRLQTADDTLQRISTVQIWFQGLNPPIEILAFEPQALLIVQEVDSIGDRKVKNIPLQFWKHRSRPSLAYIRSTNRHSRA